LKEHKIRIKEDPSQMKEYTEMALKLHDSGRMDAAARCYQTYLSTVDKNASHLYIPMIIDLMHSGNKEMAWKIMNIPEVIARRIGKEQYITLTKNIGEPWNGDIKSTEKLIVVAEQGLGDVIQSVKYICEIDKIMDIMFLCPTPLNTLIREGTNITSIGNKVQIMRNMSWIPAMSLIPLISKRRTEISGKKYITCNKERQKHWKKLLGKQKGKILVAIHWQGNPKHEENSYYAKGRSFRLKELYRLKDLIDVEFVSVQKYNGSEQLDENCPLKMVKGQKNVNESNKFEDTAAIIHNCDLVITSDSAVAHLSGAMGLKSYLLLSKIPDWRWGLEGERSAMYETIRIFRQRKANDWSWPIEMIKREVTNMMPKND